MRQCKDRQRETVRERNREVETQGKDNVIEMKGYQNEKIYRLKET